MKLELRGQQYEAVDLKALTDLKLLPLLAVMLTDDKGDSFDMQSMSVQRQSVHYQTIMRRLAQPASHYQIAYSFCAVIPSIDRNLCHYQSFVLPNGSRQEEIVFNLDADDILELFQQIIKHINDRQTTALKPSIKTPISNRPRKR